MFGDYLGIGAGAHSKLTVPGEGGWQVRRQMRWKQPSRYLAGVAEGQPLQDEFTVGSDALPFEFMMNALRLTGGFDTSLFAARTGLPLSVINTTLHRAEYDGLLVHEAGRIAPTQRGQRFLNRLLELFLV